MAARAADALLKRALRHAGTEESIACAGTALESRTAKVKKKAFLFLGKDGARVKLKASLAEATKLAKEDPERYKVGAGGWVHAQYDAPRRVLEKWIDESYALFAD